MSWVVDEWKDGLPHRALTKIREMEGKLERLGKEQKQRQFQHEQLEASYQKQIRKVEEEKSKHSTLTHENQSLSEACQKLERAREKLAHDIQSKDAHIACLEGQLSHVKQSLDAENTRNGQLKTDLERAQMEHGATMKKLGKLDDDHSKLQELTKHQKSQLENLEDKLRGMQQECSTLQRKLNTMERSSAAGSLVNSTSQVSLSGTSISDEDVKKQLEQQTALRIKLEEELKLLKSNTVNTTSTATSNTHTRHQGATSTTTSNTHSRHQGEHKMGGDNGLMDQMRKDFAETERRANKKQDELNQTVNKLEQANIKISELENKLKQVAQELQCQRHNADAARQTQEQRFKEKEKEHNIEISQQMQAYKSLDQQLQETKAKLQQEVNQIGNDRNSIQAQLERLQQQEHKYQKEIKEMKEKNNSTEQSLNAHNKKVDELNKNIDGLKREKENLGLKFDAEHKKACDLENQLKQAKKDLQQQESANGDLRAKMMDKDLERENLETKCEVRVKELNNMMENLKLQLADVKQKHSSAKDQKLKTQITELEKDKDSLTGKLQFSMNNSRRLEQDLSKIQHYVIDLEAKIKKLSEAEPTDGEESGDSSSESKSYADLKKELVDKAIVDKEKTKQLITVKNDLKKLERTHKNMKGRLQFAAQTIKQLKAFIQEKGLEDPTSRKQAGVTSTVSKVPSPARSTVAKTPSPARSKVAKSPAETESTVPSSQNDFKIGKGVKRGLSTTPAKSEMKRSKLSKMSSPGNNKVASSAFAPSSSSAFTAISKRQEQPKVNQDVRSSIIVPVTGPVPTTRPAATVTSSDRTEISNTSGNSSTVSNTSATKAPLRRTRSQGRKLETEPTAEDTTQNTSDDKSTRGRQTKLSLQRQSTRTKTTNRTNTDDATQNTSDDKSTRVRQMRLSLQQQSTHAKTTDRVNTTVNDSSDAAPTSTMRTRSRSRSSGRNNAPAAEMETTDTEKTAVPATTGRRTRLSLQRQRKSSSSNEEQGESAAPALDTITNSPRKRTLSRKAARRGEQPADRGQQSLAKRVATNVPSTATTSGQDTNDEEKNCKVQ
ncbi:uncharacterized protein [Amphiura filiformis]|uniref:uncharacterized protein n=1 Tax=Amphiura filiformis TaxID=82378 RepID=UPI003B216B8D